jgi:hypothetical protein
MARAGAFPAVVAGGGKRHRSKALDVTDRDPLHYERYGNTRYWKTVEGSRLLGVIVYKKGAKTVADRITELKQEIGGYCLSNDPLIFFPIVFVVTRAIGGEAWTPVQNVCIRTWSRPARSEANSAGYVGAVAISVHAPRHAGDRRGNNRWPSFSTVTASR